MARYSCNGCISLSEQRCLSLSERYSDLLASGFGEKKSGTTHYTGITLGGAGRGSDFPGASDDGAGDDITL